MICTLADPSFRKLAFSPHNCPQQTPRLDYSWLEVVTHQWSEVHSVLAFLVFLRLLYSLQPQVWFLYYAFPLAGLVVVAVVVVLVVVVTSLK